MSIRGSKQSPDLLLTSGNTSRSFVSLPTSVSSTFRAREHTLKRLQHSSILRSDSARIGHRQGPHPVFPSAQHLEQVRVQDNEQDRPAVLQRSEAQICWRSLRNA